MFDGFTTILCHVECVELIDHFLTFPPWRPGSRPAEKFQGHCTLAGRPVTCLKRLKDRWLTRAGSVRRREEK